MITKKFSELGEVQKHFLCQIICFTVDISQAEIYSAMIEINPTVQKYNAGTEHWLLTPLAFENIAVHLYNQYQNGD